MVRVGMTPQPKPHARCAPRREEHRCRSSGGRATTAQAYSPLATGACLSVWWAGGIHLLCVVRCLLRVVRPVSSLFPHGLA